MLCCIIYETIDGVAVRVETLLETALGKIKLAARLLSRPHFPITQQLAFHDGIALIQFN